MQDARSQGFEEMAREAHKFDQMIGALERKIGQTEASLSASKGNAQT